MWRLTFAVTMVFLGSGVVQAGLYNPAEPDEGKLNPNFKVFQDTLFPLRFIRLDKVMNDPLQMRYMMMQQTAPRMIPADWSLAQRLSLSAYLIRREKYQEAIDILDKERDNFLVYANLSSAYYLAGLELTRAYNYLDTGLSTWPAKWDRLDDRMKQSLAQMGWDEIKFRNFREAEKYQLDLIKVRRLEKSKPGSKAESLDDLFGVTFVGDSGKYEAGKLAAKEMAKLPVRALAIVQQLLVWSPNDPRLYWLLGELYNARGEVAVALQIFEELAGFNGTYRTDLLKEHMNILRAAPRQQNPSVTPDSDKTPPPIDDVTPPRFDVRTLLVGVVVGIAVSIFAYWQFREIRRRRQGRTSV